MLYVYVYACACIYVCVVVMRPMLLKFNVVHSRCCCPLCHVITLDRHCVCCTASICIQCRVVDNICCEDAVWVWTSGIMLCMYTNQWHKLCYSRLCTMLNENIDMWCYIEDCLASYVQIVWSVWAWWLLVCEKGDTWFYEGVKDSVWKDGVVIV